MPASCGASGPSGEPRGDRRWRAAALIAAALLATATAGPAWAGEGATPDQARAAAAGKLRAAEEAMVAQRARTDGDADALLRGWDAVGEQFLDAAPAAQQFQRGDEALYYAAYCFARGGSAGRVIAVTDLLAKTYPKSRLLLPALTQRGQLQVAIGDAAGAAESFWQLAQRYPAEREARDALENAIWLLAVLGQDARSLDGLALYEKLYGRVAAGDQLPRLTAGLAGLAERSGRTDAALALYTSYLHRSRSQPPAELAHVQAAFGALQWRRACPVPLVDGLCARRPPMSGGRTMPLTAVARTARPAKLARAAFAAVEDLGRGAGPHDELTLARASAQARLHQAERVVEAVLAMGPLPVPQADAQGHVTPASMQALSAWMSAWQQQAGEADRLVMELIMRREPRTAIAALARLAVLSEAMADLLLTAPIPKLLKTPELVQLYRDHLTEISAPLQARSKDIALGCLSRARDLSVVDDDVAICQRVIDRQDPRMFALDEHFARPGVLPPVLELAPPVLVDPTAAAPAPAPTAPSGPD